MKFLSISASPIIIKLFVTYFKQDWELSFAEPFENKIDSSICTFARLLEPKHCIHLDEIFFISRVMECGKSEMTWKLFFSVNNTLGKPCFPIQHFRGTINHIAEVKVRLYKPCQICTSMEGSFFVDHRELQAVSLSVELWKLL